MRACVRLDGRPELLFLSAERLLRDKPSCGYASAMKNI